MEIAVLAAGTTALTNKEIETSVQCLAFTMVALAANVTAITAGDILNQVIGNAEINIQKQSGQDTQSLIQSLSVRDLAEICAHNEGVVKIDKTAVSTTVSFTIEICNHAALKLDDNAKLMLAVSNIPSITAVTIDGIDHALGTDLYIRYETKFVNAKVSKDFNIENAYAIALPVAELNALELLYKNGKNVKLTPREIKQKLVDSQDPIYNFGGDITMGFDKFAVMSVESVLTARITLNSSTNFFLLKDQSA